MINPPACPLCYRGDIAAYYRDKKRDYLHCRFCGLVFVPEIRHLALQEEKAVYDLHDNQLADPGYREFLSRLATPLIHRLPPGSSGLDYGCGPGPLLAELLKQAGHAVSVYDPFYADQPHLLDRQYDFITCSEVVEHFRQPGQEFERLFKLLKPRGCLGLMTKLVLNAQAFSRWHYKNDPTHIVFFSVATFGWLAKQYGYRLEFIGSDVIVLTKS